MTPSLGRQMDLQEILVVHVEPVPAGEVAQRLGLDLGVRALDAAQSLV